MRMLAACLACLCGAAGAAELTSVHEIRKLSPAEAEAARPVRLKGVVTYSKPAIATLFIHDGTGGIFVEQAPRPDPGGPQVGDEVEVTGVTGKGLFATVVEHPPEGQATVQVTGSRALPPPRAIDSRTLFLPDMDCEWVEITPLVKEVLVEEGDLLLSCHDDGRDFHVLLEGPLPAESVPWDLAENRVKARGIVATTFNMRRQMTGRFIRVSSLADITPLAPIGKPDSEPPLVGAGELLRAGGAGPDQLVRVRGVATMALPGRGLFLQVDDGSLWVQTAQPVSAAPGTVIEVTGWPRPGEMKPFIRSRRAAVIGTTTAPPPVELRASDALKSERDGAWVTVAGELLDFYQSPEGMMLELRDEELVFRGQCPDDPKGLIRRIKPGSRIRITGISRVSSAGNFTLRVADKLTIMAPSVDMIRLVSPPPFWTARSVAVASSLLIVGLLSAYAIARNRRNREQETQRREFEAVLAERGRFAREIHDSLAQGLTSISLQLECAKANLIEQPQNAQTHIEKARGLVRESLREARRTVWNLRPLALGEADLAATLQHYASNLTADGRVSCSQQIEGTPRPLPPDHEAALLRIGQEALTNAIRHSGATEVVHRLRFGNGWVTLTIIDNGHGFNVADRVGKGFGLTGMHERAAALGGSLSIDSHPGRGTEVSATLPT